MLAMIGSPLMASAYRPFSKYLLLARLGSGGMAEVYLAVAAGPSGFTKLQVLKVLRPDISEQELPDFLRMFQSEARLAARLNHPNIVQSYEVGSEQGHHFIAMEYLDGQPLNNLQARGWSTNPQMPMEISLFVLCQVLEALEYAHTLTDYDGTPLGIVHRDVSPQNVFVTYTGQTKLVDFGIAKYQDSNNKTRAGVVKGKVGYMSPQQVLCEPLDHRSDVFSVGVMLWEAIARRPMHTGTSVYEIQRRLVNGDLPRLQAVVPKVPGKLDRIVRRALALKPDDRYPDASAFRADLASYLESFRKVGTRDVGEYVAQLFARERQEINRVICDAMTAAKQNHDTGSVHLLPTLRLMNVAGPPSEGQAQSDAVSQSGQRLHSEPKPASEPSMPADPKSRHTRVLTPVISSVPTPTGAVSPMVASQRGAPARRRTPLWILAGAVGASAVAAALAVASARRDAPTASPSGEEVAATNDPESQGRAALVQVTLRAVPDHAALILDGQPLGKNPYQGQFTRDDRLHTLEVSAPGFGERTTQLRFDRDVNLEVQLLASEPGEPVPAQDTLPSAKVVQPPQKPAAVRPAENRRDHSEPDALPPPKRPKSAATRPLDKTDPWGSE